MRIVTFCGPCYPFPFDVIIRVVLAHPLAPASDTMAISCAREYQRNGADGWATAEQGQSTDYTLVHYMIGRSD